LGTIISIICPSLLYFPIVETHGTIVLDFRRFIATPLRLRAPLHHFFTHLLFVVSFDGCGGFKLNGRPLVLPIFGPPRYGPFALARMCSGPTRTLHPSFPIDKKPSFRYGPMARRSNVIAFLLSVAE